MLHFKEGKNMKKILLAILAVAVVAFAEKNEKCDDPTLNAGWCYSDGYICNLSAEVGGAFRFHLGTTPSCTVLLETDLVTYPHKFKNGKPDQDEDGKLVLDLTNPDRTLRPVLAENYGDQVGALGVATTGAWLMNASREHYRVRIIYHQLEHPDINSVLLLGVTKYE